MRNPNIALCATAAIIALSAQQVQAQDVDVYQPDTAWALDFGEDNCRLMRDFTDGSNTLSLLLERLQPNAMIRVVVVGNSVRLFRGAESVGFRFTPSGSQRMGERIVSELPDGQQYLGLGQHQIAEFEMTAPGTPPGPPPLYSRDSEQEKAEAVTGIRIEQGLTKPVQINTGSLGQPIAALQACADDLLAYWGLDQEAHRSLTRTVMPGDGTVETGANGFPTNPSAGWITQNTVGFEDFARVRAGSNQVRVMVSAEGEPTSCHIQMATLDESTNQSICTQVMANGEFQPALDADGDPIDSYWMAPIFSLTPPFGG